MRLSKNLIGKQVRVRWIDPRSLHYTSLFADHHDAPKGRDLLATWDEWGFCDDITDGVIRLIQGVAVDPPSESRQQHELTYSAIPEVLIESVTILEDRPGDVNTQPSIAKEVA